MRRGRIIAATAIIAPLLAGGWIANFRDRVLAQEEHQHSHAPASAKELKSPIPASNENATAGRKLFTQHCASCHGADGKAKTDTAAAMKVRPADLTGHAVHNLSPGEIYWVATNGIRPSGMPGFKDRLSDDERWQIVLAVQKLQEQSPESPQHDQHEGHQAAPQSSAKQKAESDPHAGHDMAGMQPGGDSAHAGHDMMKMMTTVTGGPFRTMRALGSGTSLQPASAPMYAWMFMLDDWMVMLHGELKIAYNQQGGPRGVGKAESENWMMVMAERRAGPGRLMLRGMFSGEPLTTPHGGFPELFQTGETYLGRPMIDAQHPHDLFMELAASYTIPLSENTSFQIYGGPVAEPALGPVAFMHRASAQENPSAPLGHHWQDSSHITHGVVTGALTTGRFKFEVSGFHGAEPDEDRVGLDMGKLHSYSFRGWFTPTPDWAMQFSYGHLTEPEALSEGDLDRMTASISHNRLFNQGRWSSTLLWGHNSEEHGNSNSYLFESTVNFLRKNYFYTRLELIDKQGLLSDNIFGRPGLIRAPFIPPGSRGIDLSEEFERFFRLGAFTFGGVRDFIDNENLKVGIGADVIFYHKPSELDPIYGRRPTSFHIFLRFRPGERR